MSSLYLRLSSADPSTRLFVAAAGLVALLLLAAGRGITFGADDWAFVGQREGWDLATFMRPHNEHWSAVPVLAYKVLLATFGIRTYLPYQLVAVLLHLLVAAAAFQLIRREAGALLAIAAASLFLLIGYGGENLVWGFQMGWNAAMAAGAWALVLATGEPSRARLVAAAGLLIVAAASSGVGLVFIPVIGVALLLDEGLRRRLWVLGPVLVVYGLWHLAYGSSSVQQGLLDPARLRDLPDYVALGIGNAFGRTSGWGPQPGEMLALVVLVATIWRALGARPLLLGAALGFVGLFVQFGLTGLSRVQFGIDQAAAPRYVYTGAFFVLLIVASWLATVRISRARPRSLVVLGGLLAFALATNVYGLMGIRSYHLQLSNETRAAMNLAMRYGGTPALPSRSGWLAVPGRDRLLELTAAYGSPLRDVLQPAPEPPPEAYDAVVLDLFGAQLFTRHVPLPAEAGVSPPRISDAVAVTPSEAGGCAVLTPAGPAAGQRPAATAQVPGGATLVAYRPALQDGADARLTVSLYGAFIAEGIRELSLLPGSATALTVPDLGPDATWQVRVEPPSTGDTRLCLTGPARATLAEDRGRE